MTKKKIVVFTGAGISAESGIRTFRDDDGLWEKHRMEDVATPEAFERNPELVLNFYNERLKQLRKVKPNAAHEALADLENTHNVQVITQNVDDLHERAGSTKVLHLHGLLTKCRGMADPELILDMPAERLTPEDLCPKGSPLRPHVVWFGEAVPAMEEAWELVAEADIMPVVGTSLNVYPAAGLISAAPRGCKIYLVDPGEFFHLDPSVIHIKKKAAIGVPELVRKLQKQGI